MNSAYQSSFVTNFSSAMHPKSEEDHYFVNTRGGSLNLADNSRDELKNLIDDLERDYKGKIYGNYRVAAAGKGTLESIMERLGNFERTKIVYLIVEETDGK